VVVSSGLTVFVKISLEIFEKKQFVKKFIYKLIKKYDRVFFLNANLFGVKTTSISVKFRILLFIK